MDCKPFSQKFYLGKVKQEKAPLIKLIGEATFQFSTVDFLILLRQRLNLLS